MPIEPASDPVLRRLRAALDALYGDRLARVVLLSNSPRPEVGQEPEYDVAVFLYGIPERWREMVRLAEIEADLYYDMGASVETVAYPEHFLRQHTFLMQQVRLHGVEL